MIAVRYIIGGALPVMSCPERCILIGAGQMKVPLGTVTADVSIRLTFPCPSIASKHTFRPNFAMWQYVALLPGIFNPD